MSQINNFHIYHNKILYFLKYRSQINAIGLYWAKWYEGEDSLFLSQKGKLAV